MSQRIKKETYAHICNILCVLAELEESGKFENNDFAAGVMFLAKYIKDRIH